MDKKKVFNVGDIVARKSYNKDVLFKIDEILENDSSEPVVKLRGLGIRLYADSPMDDLTKADTAQVREYRRRFINRNNERLKKIFARKSRYSVNTTESGDTKSSDFFELPGRVLHVDGSPEYMKLCMSLYEQIGIKADGVHLPENDQPARVPDLLDEFKPDILILTGHDGIIRKTEKYSDINNYHNSKYFVEAVKATRRYEYNKDDLIIFAGACQSHYEALLAAGANYASSPKRVFIHAFDPVFLVEKIAFTPISEIISVRDVIGNTITGVEGLGGIETQGKYRRGFPKSTY